jgi:hypothetical protein
MDPLRTHIRKILRTYAASDTAVAKRIEELEAEGRRIVSGGQTSGDNWQVTDWRTGEVIAEGDDGLDGYDAAGERLDPGDRWFHIDHVDEDIDMSVAPTDGIPASLAMVLDDWVGTTSVTDEEIAQVAGWTVEEVRACRTWRA